MTLTLEERIQFDSHMKRSYRKVFDLAYRLAGNRSDAEDLTQEAFYRAYRGYRAYEGDKPFENWIFRIVTRLFLDLKRSRKRRVQAVSYDVPIRPDGSDDTVNFEAADSVQNPEQALMESQMSDVLEASLSLLSEEQRRLVWLADVQGVPYREIAALYRTPVGTIRSRLHRAHKQLREKIAALQRTQSLCTS